ncbi:MAG: hypothetical protein ACOYM3_18020, partial [Terrimicrobiaceae bacterium]
MDYLTFVWSFLLALCAVICLLPNRPGLRLGWSSLGGTMLCAAALRSWEFLWCGQAIPSSLTATPLFLVAAAGALALVAARQFSGGMIPSMLALAPPAAGFTLWFFASQSSAMDLERWSIWLPCAMQWPQWVATP